MWHLDTELHEKLGILGRQISKIEREAAIYTDTDSVYSCIEYAINSIQRDLALTDQEALKFCLDINSYRLHEYFERCFEKYAKYFHTKNRQNFELENISRAGIWVAKKKYVIEVASKGSKLLPKPYLMIKGLEAIQASYPIWARQNLKKFTGSF
jgi:DNA polymerase elongation subunit (family B)